MKISMKILSLPLAALLALSLLVAPLSRTALSDDLTISGVVTDSLTGAAMANVCVTLGPPIRCFTHTDAGGRYLIDLGALAATPGSTWELFFVMLPDYKTVSSDKFVVNGAVDLNMVLFRATLPDNCPLATAVNPTSRVFLPNVTKTLGGPNGWQTPFIIQNIGANPTNVEISFYRFLNGTCLKRAVVSALAPGTSFAFSPNSDTTIPVDTQFSVVADSTASAIVSVVNEHQSVGTDRAEALSYTGFNGGTKSVFLPNITRRFFGYVTPFIIQNLGSASVTVSAKFVSFDGKAPSVTIARTIDVGRSQFVDPNSEPGLVDGARYAVTVTSPDQPIGVVVNTHNDAATVLHPVAYAVNGLAGGADKVYGSYAAKFPLNSSRLSTIVVQNTGLNDIKPSITFTPLIGSPATMEAQTFLSPKTIAAGTAWEIDPRFDFGGTTICRGASPTCLADGEFSFMVDSNGGNVAAEVNVIADTQAMGYAATGAPASRYFLPNVTRTLGGSGGWSTPIFLQSVTATKATLKWYRFDNAQLALTQDVTLKAGAALQIDPRNQSLADDRQYAVVVDADGPVAAIVMELAGGAGDNAMIYEGFPAPSATQ